MEELEVMLKMLDVPYENILDYIYIDSNYIYRDNEIEIAIKKYCILNNYDYRSSQRSLLSTEWFIITKENIDE